MGDAEGPVDGPAVAAIFRYPVKGLSAEPLSSTRLDPGETIAFDRAWAVENGPGRFDEANPRHLPKTCFLTLMRDERLATFRSEFDEATETLTILRSGKPVCKGALGTRPGRAIIEQFLAAYMEASLRGAPHVVRAAGHSFSDTIAKCLHVINLASVKALEREMGRPVDPLRFRPNVVLANFPAWIEHDWVGQRLEAGSARLEVFERTDRCAATNVDPATGRRDLDIPAVLARRFGHTDFGVYARVIAGGAIAVGSPVALMDVKCTAEPISR